MIIPLDWAVCALLLASGSYCFSYPGAVRILFIGGAKNSRERHSTAEGHRTVDLIIRIIGIVEVITALVIMIIVMIIGRAEFYRLIDSI